MPVWSLAPLTALAVGAGVWALDSSGESTVTATPTTGAPTSGHGLPAEARFGGALEDCTTRSGADFPGAYTSSRNLVVGPLAIIGGAYTDPATVQKFGGNKLHVLVKAGHVVTIRLAEGGRRRAGLGYGPRPQGENKLRDTYRSVTFAACPRGDAPARYSPDGPSGNTADGEAITFWSGFVLTSRPACIALDVYVDDESSLRRAGLGVGRRCRP